MNDDYKLKERERCRNSYRLKHGIPIDAPLGFLEAPTIPVEFRAIEGFPFYCVSSMGDVYSCRTRGGQFGPWKKMSPEWSHPGTSKARLFVGLRRQDKRIPHPKTVHKLVLEAFVGPCPDGLEGCHNDGNPSNCAVSNLRWDTHKSNMDDRKKHGRNPNGVRNPAAKLSEAQVIEIRNLYKNGMYQKDIAPLFGVSKQCIQVICSGETWKNIGAFAKVSSTRV